MKTQQLFVCCDRQSSFQTAAVQAEYRNVIAMTDWLIDVAIDVLCSAKDDGVDIDALAAEIEGAGASKEPKGKKKKKGAKKDEFECVTSLPSFSSFQLLSAGKLTEPHFYPPGSIDQCHSGKMNIIITYQLLIIFKLMYWSDKWHCLHWFNTSLTNRKHVNDNITMRQSILR